MDGKQCSMGGLPEPEGVGIRTTLAPHSPDFEISCSRKSCRIVCHWDEQKRCGRAKHVNLTWHLTIVRDLMLAGF